MEKTLSIDLDHVVAKQEETPGTRIAMADADFDCRLREIQMSIEIPMDDENSKSATGDHTEDESTPSVRRAKLSFWHWLAWGGAVGTEPNWWKFQYGCGAVKTTHGATGLSFSPEKSADRTTLTMDCYKLQRGGTPAALTFKLAGCMGNCVLTAEGVGAPWRANYEFDCKLTEIEDTANGSLLELTGADTTVAEKLLANTFSVGGTNASISRFALDYGNVIEPIEDQSDATGISYFGISARRPRFSCDPYAHLAATDDVFDIVTGQTLGAISLATAAASPHFTISAPRAQLISASVGARNGSMIYDKNYKLLRNTAGANATEKERAWTFLQGATS